MFKLRSAFKKDNEKNFLNNDMYKEKPKFKDLIAIMIAEYLVILPIVIGGIFIFAFILWLMSKLWLIG